VTEDGIDGALVGLLRENAVKRLFDVLLLCAVR